MAVAHDKSTSANHNNTGADNYTHTPTGTPDYVRVCVGWAKLGSTTVSVTYGGVSMTSVGVATASANWVSSVTGKAQIFELIAPPTGAQTVALTWSAGGNFGGSVTSTYTGVNQTTASSGLQTGSAAAGTSTTASLTVTSASGDMVSGAIAIDLTGGGPNAPTNITAGDTERGRGVGSNYTGLASDMAGEASAVLNWSWTGTAGYAFAAADIIAAGGASAVTYPQLERFGHRGSFRGMLH